MGMVRMVSGVWLDPAAVAGYQIELLDVARGLGHLCRYGGACPRFYSVAEHSVRVAERVASAGGGLQAQMAALLHDAAEVYLGDFRRPLKARAALVVHDDYETLSGAALRGEAVQVELVVELERQILSTIMERLAPGIEPWMNGAAVCAADDALLADEMATMREVEGHDVGQGPAPWKYGVWDPWQAGRIWLAQYRQMARGLGIEAGGQDSQDLQEGNGQ